VRVAGDGAADRLLAGAGRPVQQRHPGGGVAREVGGGTTVDGVGRGAVGDQAELARVTVAGEQLRRHALAQTDHVECVDVVVDRAKADLRRQARPLGLVP
jgi:hypothetical protein